MIVPREIPTSPAASFFDASAQEVFWPSELLEIFQRRRNKWGIPKRFSPPEFVKWLTEHTRMRALELRSERYPSVTRYVWGNPSSVAVALSLKRDSYLSHASALWVYGLKPDDGEIFINHEQSEKPPNEGSLSQESIDRAFKNRPRETKLIYTMPGARIRVLNGKYTNQLGVKKSRLPSGETVFVTSRERTLVDIVVRPHYAGGVRRVLDVFAQWRGSISVARLAETLTELDYTYPYHQAIGFYLKRAGFSVKEQRLFAPAKASLNFYLCHAISNPICDVDWRVFYPKDLDKAGAS